MKVLLAAGGTGGHLLPAQALAERLKRQGHEVFFAGYKLTESPYFRREGFPFVDIPSGSLKQKFAFFSGFTRGLFAAFRYLRKMRPDIVVGFGSYHTAPVLAAAILLRYKLVLYEANRVMGKVNRLCAPFAERIAIQFPLVGAPSKKAQSVALFPWNSSGAPIEKGAARKILGLDPTLRTILVFGGSQGAAFLNESLPRVASLMPDAQFIHLAGSESAALAVGRSYGAARTKIKAFETNMPLAYAAADMAVCRSGAGTLAELIRFRVPAVLIPYPHAAEDHQRHNAEYLVEHKAAVCLLQNSASVSALHRALEELPCEQIRLALSALAEQNHQRMEDLVYATAHHT